ncbi:sunset domain-containing protein [Levilactobacillus andaensis]|uniref:sunset domain-containing protein n=1 Tax=Levilactobacillus andaensis TaxID=2799570 RepID=UPI0019406A24|nr:DNA-entry nuclease [Levilactobacillus andaensis]
MLVWAGGAYWAFRRPHQHQRRHLILGIISIILVLSGGFYAIGTANAKPQTIVTTKTIHVGSQRLAKAKAESKRLAATASHQDDASMALADKISSSSAASSKASSEESSQQASRRASRQVESERAVAASQAAATSTSRAAAASSSSHHSTSSHAKGDLDTRKTGKIIGNRNSKIYHTPDQAGYHMNSSNAVYFQTEAQAKAAGYRKALR